MERKSQQNGCAKACEISTRTVARRSSL